MTGSAGSADTVSERETIRARARLRLLHPARRLAAAPVPATRNSSVQRIVLLLDRQLEPEALCWAIEHVVVTGVVGQLDGPAQRDVRVDAVVTCIDAATWLADATGDELDDDRNPGSGRRRAGRLRRRARPTRVRCARRLAAVPLECGSRAHRLHGYPSSTRETTSRHCSSRCLRMGDAVNWPTLTHRCCVASRSTTTAE